MIAVKGAIFHFKIELTYSLGHKLLIFIMIMMLMMMIQVKGAIFHFEIK